MRNIILMGSATAVITVLLLGLPASPSLAVDQETIEDCENAVLKFVKKIAGIKEKIRTKFADFLALQVACEQGVFDADKCDKKTDKFVRKVENFTNTLDKQIDNFDKKIFDKFPECGDLLDELGVDDFNLF